jgi:hypothetical protein
MISEGEHIVGTDGRTRFLESIMWEEGRSGSFLRAPTPVVSGVADFCTCGTAFVAPTGVVLGVCLVGDGIGE